MRRQVLSLAALVACTAPHALEMPLPVAHRILFIGNSLTAVNDLPATLRAIAAAAGDTLRVASVVGPGLALIDHYKGATRALAAIQEGGWDYVVLQQGPTSTGGVCEDSLVLWSQLFDARIRAVGGTTALFMVWPDRSRFAYFDNVRSAYQHATGAIHGVFLPAGEAWRSAWAVAPALPLYGPDGFHPSPTGTFLAALEIYERLSGRDVRTLEPVAFANGVQLALPADTVRLLQAAAHDANQRFPALVAADSLDRAVPVRPAAVRGSETPGC